MHKPEALEGLVEVARWLGRDSAADFSYAFQFRLSLRVGFRGGFCVRQIGVAFCPEDNAFRGNDDRFQKRPTFLIAIWRVFQKFLSFCYNGPETTIQSLVVVHNNMPEAAGCSGAVSCRHFFFGQR